MLYLPLVREYHLPRRRDDIEIVGASSESIVGDPKAYAQVMHKVTAFTLQCNLSGAIGKCAQIDSTPYSTSRVYESARSFRSCPDPPSAQGVSWRHCLERQLRTQKNLHWRLLTRQVAVGLCYLSTIDRNPLIALLGQMQHALPYSLYFPPSGYLATR